MKQRKRVEWTRLENASKIFPATYNNLDTKVFRLGCELYEAIKPEILQRALDETMESFPLYQSVLRRGAFWYYFESSDIRPIVERESRPICAPIYHKNRRNLLFRVFYYHNRINLEIFHALSDGTGALWFLQTLIYYYLVFAHKETFQSKKPELNIHASVIEKMDDSFGKYFPGENVIKDRIKKHKISRVYHIRGNKLEENRMNLIEGCMSAKAVLELAHKYHTTLTILITALFIYSIFKEMPAYRKNHPIVLSVPINLRQFFPSETARNFFSTMNISYNFGKGDTKFKDVIERVRKSFEKELQEEQLMWKLNQFMSLERHPLVRILPLVIKDISLRIANKIKDREITAAITNIGTISMPLEFKPYIQQVNLCTSARRPQISVCTYQDRLVISFTSPFLETEIQRNFFQFLSKRGIEIQIASNL